MKEFLRAITPPVLLRALKAWKSSQGRFFDSYDDAIASSRTGGYESADIVDVVVRKNMALRENFEREQIIALESHRLALGVAAVKRGQTLRVLDFGGGAGTHFFILQTLLGREQDIRWNIVETDSMARLAGQKIACDGLRFFNNISDAATDLGQVDLVFTSGALQYTPDPLSTLAELLDVRAANVFITRTALNNGSENRIGLQTSLLSSNGPGPLPEGVTDQKIQYPVTFVPKADFIGLIKQKYQIRFSVYEDRAAYLINGHTFDMYGYFCDLRRDASATSK